LPVVRDSDFISKRVPGIRSFTNHLFFVYSLFAWLFRNTEFPFTPLILNVRRIYVTMNGMIDEVMKTNILENAPAIIAVRDIERNILWGNKA